MAVFTVFQARVHSSLIYSTPNHNLGLQYLLLLAGQDYSLRNGIREKVEKILLR